MEPFMHNVEKRPNILLKSCGKSTERFLKYVLPFFNIIYKKDNKENSNIHGGCLILNYLIGRPFYRQQNLSRVNIEKLKTYVNLTANAKVGMFLYCQSLQ